MKKTLLLSFAVMATMVSAAAPRPELKIQIEAIQTKGADYLLKTQMPNGSWMLHPAITGARVPWHRGHAVRRHA